MLKGNYVSLTPNLYSSRIVGDSSNCSSTSGTYKVEGSNIIWCSLGRDNDEYLCEWDATASSKGSFDTGFTNYRYAVYYSPKVETACISPVEYEKELMNIVYQVKRDNLNSDEQVRKMVADMVSKRRGARTEHVICSITNDTELESLEAILASSDVNSFIKGYVSMFSGLEFLQSEISREAPEGADVSRNFEVDSLAIFDSDCVNIDRIINYKTRQDVSFDDTLSLLDLIERDKLEDEQIRKDLEERKKSAYDILKNVKLPSAETEYDEGASIDDEYSSFYESMWDIDETIENETASDINAEINEIKDGILNKGTKDKEEPRR